VREHVAPFDVGATQPDDVDGHARRRQRGVETPAMRLQPANARSEIRWQQGDVVADREPPTRERPGDDGPGTRDREDAIDVQPDATVPPWLGRRRDGGVERRPKVVDTFAGGRRAGHDRRRGERRPFDPLADLLLRDGERLGIHEVALRERDHAGVHAEDIQDL
jgi:hypothetical protein